MLIIAICMGIVLPTFALVSQNDSTLTFGMNLHQSYWQFSHWIQTELTELENVTELTVCLNVNIHFAIHERVGVVCLLDRVLVMQEGLAYIMQDSSLFKSTDSITPYQWTHVCITFGQEISYYVDGKKAQITEETSSASSITSSFQGTELLNINMPGVSTDTIGNFGGYVTLPLIYRRKLTDEEVRQLAYNGSIPEDGMNNMTWMVQSGKYPNITIIQRKGTEVFTPLNSSLISDHGFEVVEEKNDRISLPHLDVDYIMISGRYDYEASLAMCKGLKGALPYAEDPDLLRLFSEVIEDDPNKQILLYGPKTGPQEGCNVLKYMPDNPNPIQRVFMLCEEVAVYFACKISQTMTFEMRIDEFPSKREKFYFQPMGYSPRLQSLEGKVISLHRLSVSASMLSLKDHSTNTTIAEAYIDESSNILGRRWWTLRKSNLTWLAVVTACFKDEFTCDNGVCLELDKRCNGNDDCGDNSDEQCELIKSLPRSYRSDRPAKLKTPLSICFSIVQINEVDVDLSKFHVHMQINTSWVDGRVTLVQMSQESEDNVIDEAIWIPKYYFVNGFFEDNVDYIKKENVIERTIANRISDGTPGVINSYEGFEYNVEIGANFTHIESISSSFDCDFDLLYYPFDAHICEIKIQLKQNGAHKAHFDTRNILIHRDNFTLPLFTTQPVCHTFVTQSENQANLVKIHLMMNRRYGSYVLTTILPCIILTAIGSMTKFFVDGNFSDRIMVTLSCLIVVAALISQVASTSPRSAQPKLIDILFFYSMIRLFCCFLHHTLLCLLRCFMDKKENENRTQTVKDLDPKLPLKMDVPKAASYVPPSKSWPFNAWQLVTIEPPTPSSSERMSRIYKMFNRSSIFLGFILDALFYSMVIFFVLKHNNATLKEYKENCQN